MSVTRQIQAWLVWIWLIGLAVGLVVIAALQFVVNGYGDYVWPTLSYSERLAPTVGLMLGALFTSEAPEAQGAAHQHAPAPGAAGTLKWVPVFLSVLFILITIAVYVVGAFETYPKEKIASSSQLLALLHGLVGGTIGVFFITKAREQQ